MSITNYRGLFFICAFLHFIQSSSNSFCNQKQITYNIHNGESIIMVRVASWWEMALISTKRDEDGKSDFRDA